MAIVAIAAAIGIVVVVVVGPIHLELLDISNSANVSFFASGYGVDRKSGFAVALTGKKFSCRRLRCEEEFAFAGQNQIG